VSSATNSGTEPMGKRVRRLAPMMVSAALRAADLVAIELPPSMLVARYAVTGWHIGLVFTRPILGPRPAPETPDLLGNCFK
jgi:uncharacterized membrane protein AbrB (regulator of aidB expression)